ncbi:MAG: glycosyltransferase family 4 protein [Cyclobacteriaceae bacterium]|nr:glycosyltransferase family 4 protein [Cyclobacteriaceae bacterium]
MTRLGIYYEIKPFFGHTEWLTFKQSDSKVTKGWLLMTALMRRIAHVVHARKFDRVFVHREATPIGPPWAEWIVARLLKIELIYDFDDAIWTTDREGEPVLEKLVRFRSKVKMICRWSHRVSCGNSFLASYAARFNPHVVINPTTIDTETWHNPTLYSRKPSKRLTIGWTGSHSTIKYIRELLPVFEELIIGNRNLRILVIADRPPDFGLDLIEFKKWTKENEIQDLLEIDIGVMPLPNNEWTRGKCGFKLLQYMALGIPSVAAPVGVNVSILDSSAGILATTQSEWRLALTRLIANPESREEMGRAGKEKVLTTYSVLANERNFLSLFA